MKYKCTAVFDNKILIYSGDTEMKEDQEHILWEAARAIAVCLSQGLRDELIDYLDEENRARLFSGYVLQEHYDTLKQSLDISRMSSKLLYERNQNEHF